MYTTKIAARDLRNSSDTTTILVRQLRITTQPFPLPSGEIIDLDTKEVLRFGKLLLGWALGSPRFVVETASGQYQLLSSSEQTTEARQWATRRSECLGNLNPTGEVSHYFHWMTASLADRLLSMTPAELKTAARMEGVSPSFCRQKHNYLPALTRLWTAKGL